MSDTLRGTAPVHGRAGSTARAGMALLGALAAHGRELKAIR